MFGGSSPGRRKGPDFVLEKRDGGTRALLEAKGIAVRSTGSVRARPPLKRALNQLDEGFTQLSGEVTEGYATLAVLRRDSDNRNSEGFAVRVSKPVAGPRGAAPLEDSVRRHSYGTWMGFLGHGELASALFKPQGQQDVPSKVMRVLEFGNTKIGVVRLVNLPFLPPRIGSSGGRLMLVAGLSWSNLKTIAKAVREGRAITVDELELVEMGVRQQGGSVVSMFGDGTVFGIVPESVLQNAEDKTV
jgi:hypothetical protein